MPYAGIPPSARGAADGVAPLDGDGKLPAGVMPDAQTLTSIERSFTTGEALAVGDVCRLNSNGQMVKAQADAEANAIGLIGMATEAIANGTSGVFLLRGEIESTGLSVGAEYYLATTAGEITSTRPSTEGEIVRLVGYALAADLLLVDPDRTYVEVA